MKLSVIGCGYLGAVHAASMASLGHTVVGVDVDAQKIEMLASGRVPFYEPGFDELLREPASPAQVEDYARTIHESANQLLAMINEILDFSKIEAGKLPTHKDQVRCCYPTHCWQLVLSQLLAPAATRWRTSTSTFRI